MKRLVSIILCICLLTGCGTSLPASNSTTPASGTQSASSNTTAVTSPSDSPSATPSSSPSVLPSSSPSESASPTPSASPEPSPSDTTDTKPQVTYSYMKNTDPSKYYLLLDLNNQIMTAYEKDDSGNYTKIVRQMLCSTGKTSINEDLKLTDPDNPDNVPKPTPRGIYKTGGHELFGRFPEFGNTYARYWTHLVGGVFIHSIMFSKKSVNSLQSSAYHNLGRNVSHGCVRMYVEDAQWIFYNIPPGTTINVSDKEKRQSALKKSLKNKMSFSQYNAFQKTLTDEAMPDNPTATILADNARLSNGCGGDNDKTYAKMKKGTEVEILLPGDPWCKIKYNGRVGYTLTANLKVNGSIIVSGNVASFTSGSDAKVMKATSPMYSSPDENSKVVCKIPSYTSLKVLSDSDGWSKVYYFNEVGYVQDKLIKTGWGIVYNQ